MKQKEWNIITKSLVDESLSDEEITLIEAASDQPEMKQRIDQSKLTMTKVDHYFNLQKFDTQQAWDKIKPQIQSNRRRVSFLQIAAIFLFIFASSLATWQIASKQQFKHFETAENEISRPSIVLNDGTTVILNHGSTLKYPKKFSKNNRKVTLVGEAFFNVTPNAKKPFIIKTNDATIKVLGTSFNVSAYNAKTTVEVFVKTGKVEVTPSQSPSLILNKGETGTLNKITHQLQKTSAIKANRLAWISHDITFNFTQLNEVLSTLEQVYHLAIDIDPAIDLTQKLSATFNQQDPDYVLDVVALTLNLKISQISLHNYRITSN
jgi:ferric-dicitrate binding protein FerR (iron transport regulator)